MVTPRYLPQCSGRKCCRLDRALGRVNASRRRSWWTCLVDATHIHRPSDVNSRRVPRAQVVLAPPTESAPRDSHRFQALRRVWAICMVQPHSAASNSQGLTYSSRTRPRQPAAGLTEGPRMDFSATELLRPPLVDVLQWRDREVGGKGHAASVVRAIRSRACVPPESHGSAKPATAISARKRQIFRGATPLE
jgi:transposase-like protein